ncbi:AAA family ATPase [Clostridium hydrogenum]|uniref:AAA family ATPase n=1 Tax=Clostridium hydrogenum TaxID=2855764 RepID=UPI001F397B52|nr:AAA family ATPase [Clostridium hydrogenum]
MSDFKIPYGESNFEKLITEKYIYIDKTKYIETLENDASYQFFIRPRRFGKSLFLSMLGNYYDINKKDEFDKLFGDLYIGKKPTPKKTSYFVLKLDFSNVTTDKGKLNLIDSFEKSVIDSAKDFVNKYETTLKFSRDKQKYNDSISAVNYIARKVNEINKKIFVLIDEYDNFANDLITSDEELYYDVVSSQGHIRTFYKSLKILTTTVVDRIFMTGVSPILLDDLTSGFNITKNLTLDRYYNEMMGFTEEELKLLIDESKINNFNKGTLILDMKQYYNGYLFSEDGESRVFNPNMVLYFLDSLIKHNKYPKNMLDLNIKTDYKKLENLAFNFKDEETIESILTNEEMDSNLVERFNLEYMYESKENFVSLLFYMGMLTIKESFLGSITLKVPNIAMKEIYWQYFRIKLFEKNNLKIDNAKVKQAINEMAVKGSCAGFIDYLKECLASLSNRDLAKFDEKHVKILILSIFMNNVYIANSEYEVEDGFIDILLSKNKAYDDSIRYEWLVELKYIKEKDRNTFDEIRKSGLEQIQRYEKSKRLSEMFELSNMKKLLIVVIGKKDIYVEVD